MPFLQLRITLDPSRNRDRQDVLGLVNTFRTKWLPKDPATEYTCGYEELNKYGEPCDPHVHFNCYFELPDLKDPLRSAKEFIKRSAVLRDFRLKGNKAWSCTLVEHPSDFRRWIRYPLKESPIPGMCYLDTQAHPSDPTYNLTHLELEATSERKRSIEINILKREKLADKSSFRDKLFEHLDDKLEVVKLLQHPLPSHQDIWVAILSFYHDSGKPVCFKTITGYTVGYQLHIKAITPLQCYVMRSNPQ